MLWLPVSDDNHELAYTATIFPHLHTFTTESLDIAAHFAFEARLSRFVFPKFRRNRSSVAVKNGISVVPAYFLFAV